jgi:hypothetical protein
MVKMGEGEATVRIDHTIQKGDGTVHLALFVEVSGDDNVKHVDEYKEFLDRKIKNVIEDFVNEPASPAT